MTTKGLPAAWWSALRTATHKSVDHGRIRPSDAARLVRGRARARILDAVGECRDRLKPSLEPAGGHRLHPVLKTGLLTATDNVLSPGALATASLYAAQRHDVLGSGWTDWTTVQPQSVNFSNRRSARRVRSLLPPGHAFIDWHADRKSGYVWNARGWSKRIIYQGIPGVDVKVPWELARGQFLPQLAVAYSLGHPSGASLVAAIRSHILDFIATNPPRWGVNWVCSMDVGIRVANWLVAWDVLRAAGVRLDDQFEATLATSVEAHARHIVRNLEWSQHFRSNHYLADVAGLLIAAAYLQAAPRSDAWLRFAVFELMQETTQQFLADGANFEASTCYHRLSLDTVVWATAFALACPMSRLTTNETDPSAIPRRARECLDGVAVTADHLHRVRRAVEFTRALTKPDGHIAQIGDNDSGRFLRLSPPWKQFPIAAATASFTNLSAYVPPVGMDVYWYEDDLDHTHLYASVAGLTGDHSLAELAPEGCGVDLAVASALAGGRVVRPELSNVPTSVIHDEGRLSSPTIRSWRIEPGHDGLRADLTSHAFPDFGVYIYRSRRLFLAIRCGSVGQRGKGGHAHNDQLGLELCIDGIDWYADPGTGVYTPHPGLRNEYRSVHAHFVVRDLGEQNALDVEVFALPDRINARCLRFDQHTFVGVYEQNGVQVGRSIDVADDCVLVRDHCSSAAHQEESVIVRSPEDLRRHLSAPHFSPRYGWFRRDEE